MNRTDREQQGKDRDTPPLNREERRRERFGPRDAMQDNERAQTENNPAFGRGGDDQAAYTGRPDQDVTRRTGAGTGGATESDDRVTNREGIHLGNQPNS